MVKQGTPEWFAQRIGKITGSRIGSILGLNPYQSADDVLRDMVREYHGAEPEFTGNSDTERGHRLEPIAAGLVEDRFGWLLIESPLHVHKDYDWLAASPDRLSIDMSFGVEIKAPRKVQPLASKPQYEAQIRLCMECTGIKEWKYVSYVEGEQPHVETVEHDPEWLPSIMPQIEAFYARYQQEIDNPAHLEPLIMPRDDDDWMAAVQAWKEAKQAADSAANAEKDAKAALIKLAGDRASEGGGVRVQYVERAGNVDWSKVQADYGIADVEQYRKKATRYARVEQCKS